MNTQINADFFTEHDVIDGNGEKLDFSIPVVLSMPIDFEKETRRIGFRVRIRL